MATTVYGRLTSKQIQKDTEVIDQKVYGFQFPIKDNKRGYFSKQTGIELVKNNLKQLLRTERGERVMLPNYGVSLRKYLFEPLDRITFQSLQTEILTSISNYMPNVDVLKLSVVNNEDIGYQGVTGIVITLGVALKEFQNNLIEIEVKVG